MLAFDLTISAAATTGVVDDGLGGYTANATGANVNVADILADLVAGFNVTINNGATGAENGNIAWNAALDINGVASNRTLSVTADATSLVGDISLNAAISDSVAGGESLAITFDAEGAVALAASIDAAGNLTILADGAINQTVGSLLVTTASFTTGAAAISLTQAANNFTGVVTLSNTGANNVSITDANAIDLAASTIGGNLTVVATGAITDSGALSVTGTTTLTAGAANNVTLDNANAFGGAVSVVSGNTVAIVDAASALDIGASTISGNLALTAGGSITDSGALAVTGTTTLDAGAANSVTLDNLNAFGGAVSVVAALNVTLVDSSSALDLGASTISGNLAVIAGGAVTDSAALSVTGTTTVTAGIANNVTLDNANAFGGAVAIVSANDVTLVDAASGIDLGMQNVSGNLAVTAGGSVIQSGLLTVAGTSLFTVTAALSDMLLGTQANNLTGATSFAVSGAGTARDITLRNVNATSSLAALPATARDVTVVFNNSALVMPAATLTGNLALTAGGAITDGAALAVTGTTSLAAGAGNNITLDNANAFGGAVGVASGLNVTLVDSASGIVLGAQTVSGNLAVTAGGSITQTGVLAVTGGSTFTVTAALADILLNTSANNLAGAITVGSSGGGSIRDLALRNVNGAAALPALPAGLRNLTLEFNNAAVALPATTLTGNLALTAGGAITDTGAVVVAGTTSLTAPTTSNIALDTAGNDFAGAVTVFSGANVTLVDAGALDLAATTVTGNLAVTANGAVTDSGTVIVNGTTTIVTGTSHDVTLNSAANDFVGAVSVTSVDDLTLVDVNGIILGALTVSGALSVTAAGTISDLAAATLAITGATTLTAGAANNITLDNAGNNYTGAVSVVSGSNVTLVDVNAVALAAMNVSGFLSVTAAGAISNNGALTIAGTSFFSAGAANSVTLNNAGNDFAGAVTVASGNNVTLVDINALTIATATVSGSLNVTSLGINATGNVTVAGTTTLAAGAANDIVLNAAGNDFVGAVTITSANDVTLVDVNALTLAVLTLTNGNLSAASGNALSLTGNVAAGAGTVTFNPTTGGVAQANGTNLVAANLLLLGAGTFTLNQATNDVNSFAADVLGSVTFRDADDLTVGTVSGTNGIATGNPGIGGNVVINAATVTINQAINTQTGAGGVQTLGANVTNNSTITLGAGSVAINDVTGPTVTVNQAATQDDPSRRSPIVFTVVFSEPVTGFVAGDVSLTGTTAAGATVAVAESGPLNGTTYTINVTGMTTSGKIVVSLPAGAATDLSGNLSAASTSTDNSVTFESLIVTGADAGGGPHVVVRDAITNTIKFSFFAYAANFLGGVRVATGDVTGDGVSDIVTAPGPGGGPHVKVFDGVTGAETFSLFAYTTNFTGGVFIAVADLNNDGRDDIITAAGAGGGPHIRVFSGANLTLVLADWFAYDTNFLGGVTVAAGDINDDGTVDVITGAGPGGGPHIKVFSGITTQQIGGTLGSFFAYSPTFTGGVYVSAGDVNADSRADIIIGAGATGGPHVKAISGATGAELLSFFAYNASFTGGVRVGAGDIDGDGRDDIITGPGPGGGPHVRVWSGANAAELQSFFAYPAGFTGGVFVAGSSSGADGAPQLLAGSWSTVPGEIDPLTQQQLDPIVEAAIASWAAAGMNQAGVDLLRNTPVRVEELPANYLGYTLDGGGILIDIDAAGAGWFIDLTPFDGEEFILVGDRRRALVDSLADKKVDLLTVVMHELGVMLGLYDADSDASPGDLMSTSLETGERREPTAEQVDKVFELDRLVYPILPVPIP